jgi:hypothetical protein
MSLLDHQFDLKGYCLDDTFDLAQYPWLLALQLNNKTFHVRGSIINGQ